MNKKSFGWIIGIVFLMLLSTFVLVGCKKSQKKEQENAGMKVSTQEDTGEGESGAFEEFFPESEENKTDAEKQSEGAASIEKDNDNDNDNDNVNDSANDNDTSDETEQRPSSSENPEKKDEMNNNNENSNEDNNEDNNEEEKGQITGEEEDKEEGWGPII